MYQAQPCHHAVQPITHRYQSLGGFLLVLIICFLANAVSSFYTTLIDLPEDLDTIVAFASVGASASAALYVGCMAMLLTQTVFEILLIIALFMKNRHIITLSILGALAGLLGLVCLAGSYALDPLTTSSTMAVYMVLFVAVGILVIVIR